jgi:hypothetical protein
MAEHLSEAADMCERDEPIEPRLKPVAEAMHQHADRLYTHST